MRTIASLLLILSVGCGGNDDDPDATNNPVQNAQNKIEEAKDDVKAEVIDTLDCSGTITEETRTLVTEALTAADFDPTALATTPEELARFIGAVAVSTDSTAMLVGNIGQIARIGSMGVAHAGMWDTLTCDETETVPCVDAVSGATSGEATSTVECEAGVPSAVRVDFADDCTLFVTQNSGALSLLREGGVYEFDNFAIGSVRQVDGLLAVDFESSDVHRMTVAEEDGISIATNAGKSCEERLSINRLVAETSAALLSIDIDANRLADGKTMSFSTPMGAATFTRAAKCTCPDPGSVVDWQWTGFIKGEGDANLRLTYREAEADSGCADVGVEIMSWPEQCDSDATDCGKAAVESLLGPLLAATCVTR